MKTTVSIIIVNYNTKKFVIPCLFSIGKYAPEDTEVIVVDNASTDGSVNALKNLKTEKLKNLSFQLIENKENLGYAKAVNQALRQAQGEYFFILNPDTKIKEGSIQELLNFTLLHKRSLTSYKGVIVGPRLLNPDGSVQASCYHQPGILGAIKEYFLGVKGAYEKYAPRGNAPVQVDALVGAAMFIPKTIIERVGLFDERFFMYFEDLDFCRRVKRASLKVYYLPKALVYHEHGGATREVSEQAKKWLVSSSKTYHGVVKYAILTLILWLGQKWHALLKKI